jgi:hypothetical protein
MFDDPIQGDQNNCSLIASLSSVAWVMESLRLSCTYLKTNADKSRNYNVSFWPGPVNVPVSDVFPLDTLYDQPYCNAHARDKLEIWPALYEKAYAAKFHNAGENPCPLPQFLNDINSPNKWHSNPLKPLWNLTGCGNSQKQEAFFISDSNSYDFFQEIKNRCNLGKTVYPMTAWVKPQNLLPNEVDGVIKPDHVYTVLGHKFVNNVEYLIIRDPTGVTVTNPPSPNCILSGNVTFNNNFRQNCSPISRNYYNRSITVPLGLGIFGLAGTKIEEYFQGFAWAGPGP